MLPEGAELEEVITPRVAVWDVVDLLPKGGGVYPARHLRDIDTIFCHKSGADGPQGFRGVLAMASFITSPKPPEGYGRGWKGGSPYMLWVSNPVPDRDTEGRLVVYRAQRDTRRAWHTGGQANRRGVALAMQGAFDSEWDLLTSGRPRIEVEPSEEALECWEAAVMYLRQLHGIPKRRVVGHFEARVFGAPRNKRVCPGDFLRQWILDYRQEAQEPEVREPTIPPPADTVWQDRCPSVHELQAALQILGHAPGPIDGIWGHRSRGALERFQAAHQLRSDGWFGGKTATALQIALARTGITTPASFQRALEGL